MDFNDFKALLTLDELPKYDYLFSLCDKISSLLESEICEYRPAATVGTEAGVGGAGADSGADGILPGSLIEINQKKPVIVVPDIHARRDFLLNILNFKIPDTGAFSSAGGLTVFDALKKGEIFVVCVGDAVHSERQNKTRWLMALEDYVSEIYTGNSMTAEMIDSLGVLAALMELKLAFPNNFHFLKGNHENIMNKTGSGDFAFRKFADEGNMTRDFIQNYYGDDILYLISLYENALPLVFANPFCVVSHAEPRRAYSRQELINARLDGLVVEGLTWTRNGESREGCVQQIIDEIFEYNGWCDENANSKNAYYFAGHSPIQGDYALRQGGRFIQIHNPSKQNIIIAGGSEPFALEKNIYNVQNIEEQNQEEQK